MQHPQQELTQKERLGQKFLAIKPDVSIDDRKAYMLTHHKTASTVSWYLNGKVKDIDTGLQMYEFFKQRIEARELQINENNS